MIKKILKNNFLSLIFYLVIGIIIISMTGCQNTNIDNKSKTLSIVLETKNSEDVPYITSILDEFKKINENYNVTVIEENNLKNMKQNIINKKYDIVISSRDTFLTLNEDGLIKDLTSYFNQNKSQSKFYDIIYAYGKVGDKNLGMGLFPSSIEVLYNKDKFSNVELEDLKDILKKENFKVPYVLPDDININLALSSIVSNSIIKENNLVSIYNGDKNKYLDVIDIPNMFKDLNLLEKDYNLQGKEFVKADISILENLNNGEIPFVITTSNIAKNLAYSNIESVSNLGINKYRVTPPIISRYTVYATSSSENLQSINKFFDYMISNDTYKALAEKGIITGNKEADSNAKGLNKIFVTSISKGSQNNIPYYLNLPESFLKPLNEKLKDIIDYGYYNSDYWIEIVNKVFG